MPDPIGGTASSAYVEAYRIPSEPAFSFHLVQSSDLDGACTKSASWGVKASHGGMSPFRACDRTSFSLPTQVVNDKGRYRQSRSARSERIAARCILSGLACDRDFEAIVNRVQ